MAKKENKGNILGILSIIFGILFALVGVILGIIGLTISNNNAAKTLNIIGISVSIISWIIGLMIIFG